MIRLDLGAGDRSIPGFIPVDIKAGARAYPLDRPAASVDEIRASHVLEHFSHRDTLAVLTDWARALKPGGLLRLAVPDFAKIAKAYLAGERLPIESYVMGGHMDDADKHGALFDEDLLRRLFDAAGFVDVEPWTSELPDDCAALPISLNLQGRKRAAGAAAPLVPTLPRPKVSAVMSVPRLGFMDNFFCCFQALVPLGIEMRKFQGAFWGQCLTRAMEQALQDGADYILTIDYDTVFTRKHVERLIDLAMRHPAADAIAPIQASRMKSTPLFTLQGPDGLKLKEVSRATFDAELVPASTAHFGLTLIKTAALREFPRPWFKGEPDRDGRWGDGRVDDDIWFWRQWQASGRSLAIASRVAVGHAELMVRWPDANLEATYQHPSEFHANGEPENVWK